MKRITFAFMSTVSAVVLLFGYRTSTSSHVSGTVAATAPADTSGGSTSSSAATAPTAAAAPSSSSSTSAASGAASSAPKTYTGSVIDTRWGPVQVQITVQNSKVTNVSVLQYPNSNGRDTEINQYALPALVQETIQAQSANIDMISGATYTSQGYISSLQSALDKAGLK